MVTKFFPEKVAELDGLLKVKYFRMIALRNSLALEFLSLSIS